jgi:hypothetical protein
VTEESQAILGLGAIVFILGVLVGMVVAVQLNWCQ